MSVVTRLLMAVIAAVGLGAAAATLAAGPAGAASCPYSSCVSLSVTDQNPPEGGTDGVNGSGWTPGDTVNLTLHTVSYPLGTVTVTANGTFSTTVDLPAGVTGAHQIVGTDPANGDTAAADITIGGSGTGSGGTGSSGGLSNTGVAVLSIGSLGALLVIGGGVLMVAGRRRRVTA